MSDPADLAHQVLVKVAEFVRKLPAAQLEEVVTGAARIDLIPKGARVTMPKAPKVVELPTPARDIQRTMLDIGTRSDAKQYVTDLKLSLDQLKLLATELQIPASGTKAKLTEAIVEAVVGRIHDSISFSRVGGGR